MKEGIENIYVVYDAMGGNNSVAKGREFVSETLEIVREKIKEENEAQQSAKRQ